MPKRKRRRLNPAADTYYQAAIIRRRAGHTWSAISRDIGWSESNAAQLVKRWAARRGLDVSDLFGWRAGERPARRS